MIMIIALMVLLRVDYENNMQIKGIPFVDPNEAKAEEKADADKGEGEDEDGENDEETAAEADVQAAARG